jgi:SH3 domain protein
MYISDKLVVNLYAEASQESNKVTTLDSGDAVEAIEKLDSYTHVRLADGREGWIKSSYLINQVPAIVRLKELEKERGASAPTISTSVSPQLAEEVKQLKEQNAALQAKLATAKTAAAQPVAPVTTNAPTALNRFEGERGGNDQPAPTVLHPVGLGTGFFAVGGVIGFALGYQALARRIRRKYGSVRIY